ncbi:MAG: hypothetical protein OEN02_03910 [Gammaproteobacteria bacterium]|nr:hypothetical protein [Gammaproteobacteria bacterium]MDH3534689.1 hypothetical protein [Gammaproteobacteria bacterium]
MPNRIYTCGALLLALSAGLPQSLAAAELSTLFTTPQERQIINANRYKDDKPKPVRQVENEKAIEIPRQQLAQEEVKRQYRISGITVSRDSPPSVWINSVMYEDGDQLDDNSRVTVLTGGGIRVRITAPDGKNYYATSGQTLDVTYLAPVAN